ncbi:uncharacterized protein LOC141902527 [Tubulanus polymorphus]|uniref:uncharacterized protein LOC141902527 n=1 Tax=Tubulanus polymorphus TaxID=672921 RepID=UPI003DA34FC1
MFNVCERTIAQRVMEFGLRVSNMSDKLSDDILDDIVADAVAIHPNWGEKLHAGHIQSLGLRVQRDRIRESLRRVDPDGIDERKRKTLKRREYWVPGPNFIWHVDGNHKLIRWRIVIHGGIDGFSRIPVFMRCSNNNRADTVFRSFKNAVERYGLPQKVRSDHGGENVLIADYIIAHPDRGPGHFITGRSVHNQRIERLWRDVYSLCTSTFYNLFHSLEEECLLIADNDVDLYVLHMVFLPRLQNSINRFIDAWICHKVRTVGQSPLQLWLRGENQGSPPVGDHLELMAANLDDHERVMVPLTPCPIDEADLPVFQELSRSSMETEHDLGKNAYIEIRQAFLHLLL